MSGTLHEISGTLHLVDAALDSTAGACPNFITTQWGLVAAASTEGTAETRAALEELYRLYCYPVYAFIRRRGYRCQDAHWSISYPMPPNAPVLANGVAGANGCFWMAMPWKTVTSLRRPKG
jgi:hypothetical protein